MWPLSPGSPGSWPASTNWWVLGLDTMGLLFLTLCQRLLLGFWVFAALIKQFVSDVAWGELDCLVVDTPPGTSDEHMAAVEALRPHKPLWALVVTTPQVPLASPQPHLGG